MKIKTGHYKNAAPLASLILVGVLAGMITGCAATSTQSADEARSRAAPQSPSSQTGLVAVNLKKNSTDDVEKINGLAYDGTKLSFTVLSNGCTREDDFRIDSTEENDICAVTIVRTKPDLCRMATTPVPITVEWNQPAGCSNIVVTNPLLITQPLKSGALPKRKVKK